MAINTLYLDKGILMSARNAFRKQIPNNIRLENFFQKPVFRLLQDRLCRAAYKLKFRPYHQMYSTTGMKEIDSFILGGYFKGIVRQITGITGFKPEFEVRRFQAGDYTLLHDESEEEPAIDFIIDFSRSANNNHGGHTVYLNEKEELLHINPVPNSLSFVDRSEGMMKYTKYVTHGQKSPIIQIVGSLRRRFALKKQNFKNPIQQWHL